MTSKPDLMPTEGSTRPTGLSQLLDTRLPLNRKEAFFTATVLPAIICADSFKHFDRFLNLLGLGDVPIDISKDKANIQFFTEYCLAESICGDFTEARFLNPPHEKVRPDVMILIEGSGPLLIAVEAKLYSSARASDLKREMEKQENHVLSYLEGCWPGLHKIHAALLPEAMKKEFGDQGPALIVTWEDILRKYEDVESARYFREILEIALHDYDILKSPEISFGTHADGKLTGADILRRHQIGDSEFQAMGRRGGIDGGPLKDDIADNRWQEHEYEVRRSSAVLPTNWFLISDFVALVSRKNLITVFGQVLEAARDSEADDAAFGHHVRQLLREQGGVDVLAAQCEAASQPTE
jgi:hypothetical protein